MNKMKISSCFCALLVVLIATTTASAQVQQRNSGAGAIAQSGSASASMYQLVYQHNLPADVTSIAVANLDGTNRQSLIYLRSLPGNSPGAKLVIAHWHGSLFITDSVTTIAGSPGLLEVGKFAGANSPVIIATSDGVRYWQNGSLRTKAFAESENIVGKLDKSNDSSRLLIASPQSHTLAYQVKLAPAGNALVNPVPMPASSSIFRMDLRSTPVVLQSMGLPATLVAGGIMGLWRTDLASKLLLYYLVSAHQQNAQGKTFGAARWSVMFVDPTAVVPKSLYTTPVLPGSILSVAHNSPLPPYSPGLLVLTGSNSTGTGTGLYFFRLVAN